jgi:hypothetical protein
MLAALIMLSQASRSLPAESVEQLAREMGMVYPHETVSFVEEMESTQ